MGDYRKIFLIVDPSRQQTPAFRRAVLLARATGATLHLGLFEHSPSIPAMGLVSRPAMEQARRAWLSEREHWLDGVARKLTEQGVLTSSEVEWRAPLHNAIAEHVLELNPDIVLKDVQHEPALSRVLFTPLDWHLLRLCPVPLLLVTGRDDHWPRRVLAAVDTLEPPDTGGRLNERIVEEALRLAIQFNGEVHLVHAFEGLPPVATGMLDSVEGLNVAYEQLAEVDRQRFEEFAQRHGVPEERKHLLFGPPAHTLAEFARDATADLIVLGGMYRTGLERLLMGSTAEHLLSLVRCDVLAVKPEGFRAVLARHLGLESRGARQAA